MSPTTAAGRCGASRRTADSRPSCSGRRTTSRTVLWTRAGRSRAGTTSNRARMDTGAPLTLVLEAGAGSVRPSRAWSIRRRRPSSSFAEHRPRAGAKVPSRHACRRLVTTADRVTASRGSPEHLRARRTQPRPSSLRRHTSHNSRISSRRRRRVLITADCHLLSTRRQELLRRL
jgi:hypothetical protein